MATSGPGWRLAASLVTLGNEIRATRPNLTCLGTLGNLAHQLEGTASDHNPFVKDAKGVGVVRAIDIGGPDADLRALRQHLWVLYAQQDPRVYRFGYMKGCSDNLINNWGLPFGVHIDTGDAGHLHISVTQVNGNNPSAAGYVSAIDSTASWGLSSATFSGGGTTIGGFMAALSDAQQQDMFNAIARIDQGKSPTLIQQIHDDSASIWRAPEMKGIIQAACAAAVVATSPTIDYTKLAAALIAQLKAA